MASAPAGRPQLVDSLICSRIVDACLTHRPSFRTSYAYGIPRPVRWKWAVVWAMTFGSLEDALQAIDSIGPGNRVFMLFGGPPRAIWHSLAIAILPADLAGALARDSRVTRLFPAKLVGA
jgi:hypothetical protein